ncbi:MAG TPA: hypothetical protein VNN25_17100 [Thermoanaerobaculia bacterium]|nr:hypothetical protein [Thermoanaerobaculia bacterium]
MGTLTITFSGICTHFHDCLPWDQPGPKIPMRSVLPNAMGVYFGMVQLPPPADPSVATYYLMPHVAQLSSPTADAPRRLLYGVQLEVVNVDTTQPEFTFDWSIPGYHLREYVPKPEPEPSPDVVSNYKAACYFDFHFGSGKVVPSTDNPLMLTTQVQLATNGPPVIRVSPFPGSPAGGDPWFIQTETLFVANQDFDADVEDKPFDFMLNYLVTQQGLPQLLTENMPGMEDGLEELTPAVLGKSMVDLGVAILNLPPPSASGQQGNSSAAALFERLPFQSFVDLDQSCSDSHFP